jgi:DNA-binding GntR family transcriptional regulator
MVLSPLRESPSLNTLAYNRIKEAILTFKFMPKQALIEGDLAAQLGISKTPVRDALLQLEQDGLVERIPFKGTYVSELSNQDMADTYLIRSSLEGLAVRLATNALTEKDYRRLEALIHTHENALNKDDYTAVTRTNAEFHTLLIDHCGNPRLIKMLESLDDNLKRYRLLSFSQGVRKEKSIREHQAIFNAVLNRKAEEAEAAMKMHLESAITDLSEQNIEELLQNFKSA